MRIFCLSRILFRVICAITLLMASGCAYLATKPQNQCDQFADQLQNTIARETHFDPSVVRPVNSPFIRSDRFWSSFDSHSFTKEQKSYWLAQLHQNALQHYETELARLSNEHITDLESTAIRLTGVNSKAPLLTIKQAITQCFSTSNTSADITNTQLQLPDSYSATQKLFGIYPLMSLLAQSSIDEYRDMMQRKLSEGASRQFTKERIYQSDTTKSMNVSYSKLSYSEIATWIHHAKSRNPLQIPELGTAELASLFNIFAPEIQIETLSEDDQLGQLNFSNGSIVVNTSKPTLYTYPSYTRFQNQVLLQLNYQFWYPSRPAEADFDIYAGDLDGLIWRVTLKNNGKPLVYDSIHPCGCYHKLYLPEGTQYNANSQLQEQPLTFRISESEPTLPSAARIKIEAVTHYVVDVTYAKPAISENANPQPLTHYQILPYDKLLMLKDRDEVKSIFGDSGIIEQSQRIERWFLWPLGVPNAGAMRQRGLHAIAFIGERHFDDPSLLEELGVTTR